MKKYCLLFIILFVNFYQSNAQLLWKVSGNGLEKPSYIFGTHHVAPLSILDSLPAFNEAFNSCSVVYGEIVMDKEQMQKEAMKYAGLMMATPDSTLNIVLNKEQFQKLNEITTENMGVSADQVKILKPAALSSQLAVMAHIKHFKDFKPEEQIDQLMQTRAKAANKKTGGLETLEQQMNLLFGVSITEQAKTLAALLDHYDQLDKYAQIMNDAYMAQDLNKLFNIMSDEEFGANKAELERILFARNRNWNEQLRNILPKNEPIFIVVGAGHLPGEEGIIELLRKQGYTVEPA
ncbi:MAG: TraB/GumN family protein [Bacteroidales bacterium]